MLKKWLYLPRLGSELEVWADSPSEALQAIEAHLCRPPDARCLLQAPSRPREITWEPTDEPTLH